MYTKCVQMGDVRIFSKLDQEAHKALQDYRVAIGLEPVVEFARPPKIVEVGEWVDQLALEKLGRPWDLFVTATFRPVVRRWKNPSGFAALETALVKGAGKLFVLTSADLTQRLASHSPSAGYVQRFFSKWIGELTQMLQTRVDFFVGFEAGTFSGANHFHALVGAEGLHDYSRHELWQDLYDTAGRSLVLPFDSGRGAGWYLAASYVGKKQLGWDVSVGNRALIQSRPARGDGQDLTLSAAMPREQFHSTLGRWHR
jgi:hypothetical protein